MVLPPKVIHPKGDTELNLKKREISALVADTFDGKIYKERGQKERGQVLHYHTGLL
jgi:hypothetical protein